MMKHHKIGLGWLCLSLGTLFACSDKDENAAAAGGAGTGGMTQSSGGAAADAGAAGAAAGGAAGENGSENGGAGQGGEGGGFEAAVDAACAEICEDQVTLSCYQGEKCIEICREIAVPPPLTAYPDDYLEMIRCQAEKLTAADYYCSQMEVFVTPAPVADTACEDLICKWTCIDATFGDINVYTRCACQ